MDSKICPKGHGALKRIEGGFICGLCNFFEETPKEIVVIKERKIIKNDKEE